MSCAVSHAADFNTNVGSIKGYTSNIGSISTVGTNTNLKGTTKINMSTNAAKGAVAQVDWQNLTVKNGDTVNFAFSKANQTIINRVLGG